MPLYDFRCPGCGHEFEENIASTAAPPPCPECKAATEKVLTMPHYNKGKPPSEKLLKARHEWKNATKEERKKIRGGLD